MTSLLLFPLSSFLFGQQKSQQVFFLLQLLAVAIEFAFWKREEDDEGRKWL